MAIDFFANMDADDSTAARPDYALWTLDLDDEKNEKQIVNWLNGELNFIIDEDRNRFRRIVRNIQLYKGIQYETQELREDIRDRSIDRSRAIAKIVVNHLFDLAQSRISRLIKFKPAVAILPTNDEFEDAVAANMTKDLLKHIWYIHDFEGGKTPQIAINMAVTGEAYFGITWDPDSGDIHPDSPRTKKEDGEEEFEKIPLLDESGKQQKDQMGNPVWIEKPIKVGDVKYEVIPTQDVYIQRCHKWEDAEYCFIRRTMPVEQARLKYPESASKIKRSQDEHEFDFESLTTTRLVGQTVLYEFYHKKTPGMPNGRYMVFTRDALIANTEHPYTHGGFPFERITDNDVPNQLHGESFFENIKTLTSAYNNITNMILRNQILVAHPKWMVPAGSVKLDSLGNDITIVQYKGPQPPVLVQANPTGREVFEFRTQLKEEFQQISGVFGVSRGEPPPGIKAGVALQFLNEQEAERANISVLKWNDFIRRIAIKTLAVAGDYYDADDDRMIRVVGKNDKWKTVFFDSANLSKDYDVRIQNSSALSDSKAQRVQTLLDLSEKFPDLFTGEQVLDMLELGQNDKFVDQATVAVKTAEAENEMILNGEDTTGVQEYENHLLHWRIHVKALQEYSYKEMTPKKIRDKFEEHVKLTEYYMWLQAKKNPTFAEKIKQLDLYPIFFTPDELAIQESAPQPEAPLGGEALPGLTPAPEGLPVNPELGGEAQAPIQENVPPLQEPGLPPEPPSLEGQAQS